MTRAWLVALVLAGCGPPPTVQFATAPPAYLARDYDKVHARWTRYAHVRHTFDTALDAGVTLLSEDFRAAYVARVSAMRGYTQTARAEMAEHERADVERYVDFLIVMQTGQWTWNDLASPRSVWTMTLLDDRGRDPGRPTVTTIGDKPDLLAELFRPVTPFTRAWRVRFPRQLPDGTLLADAATRWIKLRVAGPLGATEVRWEAQR